MPDANTFLEQWEQCSTAAELRALLDAHQQAITTEAMQEMKKRASRVKERAGLACALLLVDSMCYAAELSQKPLHKALALMTQGNAARWQGHHREAIGLYDEARDMALIAGSELEAARSQVGKIFALGVITEYEEAIRVGETARPVLLAHAQTEAAIGLDVNLGPIHWRLGHYEQALEVYNRGLALLAQVVAQTNQIPPRTARLLQASLMHNSALVLAEQNRYREALEKDNAALQIQRELGNTIEVAKHQESIAFYNLHLGQYNKALRLLDEAREVFVANNEKDYILFCDLYIIQCHNALNRFDLVAERSREVLNYLWIDGREATFEAGRVHHHLGVALTKLGHPIDALASFEQCRRIFAAITTATIAANPLLDQAELHFGQQEYAEAERLCQQAAAIFQEKGVLADGARCAILLSKVRLAQKDYAAAEILAKQAELDGQTAHTPLIVYQALLVQADIAEQQGQMVRALELYRAGLEAVEEMRGRVAAEGRASFVEDKEIAFQGAVALSLEAQSWSEALELVERGKSRSLVELLAGELDIRVRVRDENDRETVVELEQYRAQRNELISQLANWNSNLFLNTRDAPLLEASPESARGKLVEQVRDYERRIRALVEKLQVRNAAYAEDLALQPPSAKIDVSCLDADTVLVEYYICRGEVLAFIVSSKQSEVQAVRSLATERGLNQLLSFLRINLAGVTRTLAEPISAISKAERIKSANNNARGLLQKLYRQLIAPLSEHLAGYRKLIIVPHGLLHYLPFHALLNEKNNQYLLQEWEEVSYLPSGSLLSFCHKRGQRPEIERGRGALVMGNSSNQSLPHCPEEARRVAGMLDEARLYLEEAATPAQFVSDASQCRVIHLATHGKFRQDDPLFSSLLLHGGELTAQDLFNCELKASLVTFSACETGLGKLGGGDELLGLSRACLYAGASSLVMSLWQVEDESVARLMQNFYAALLKGQRKGAALREAQLELLQDELHRHPFFWAPFTLIGHSGLL